MKKVILLLLISLNLLGQEVTPYYPDISAAQGYNVKLYGCKGDGTTDDRAALNTLLQTTAPTGSTIFFPYGTYSISASIDISNKKFNFVGAGATLKTTANDQFFVFTGSGSSGCKFSNITFLGNDVGATQIGVYFNSFCGGYIFNNCNFTDLGGAGIAVDQSNVVPYIGGIVSNCKFYSSNYGFWGLSLSEYVQIIGCEFTSCVQAIEAAGGNMCIVGNNILYNTNGIRFLTGTNNGHSIIADNNINHNTSYSLRFSDISNGMTVQNNHIYQGNISISTCTGVTISGGIINADTYTFTNNANIQFNRVMFDTTYANTISLTGTSPIYKDCYTRFGRIATDADNFVSGAQVKYTLTGSATLDFGNTVAGASTDLTITVTGASDGDVAMVGPINASSVANGCFTAWVSAANTVTVRYSNNSLVTAYDPASGVFKVIVFKQ